MRVGRSLWRRLGAVACAAALASPGVGATDRGSRSLAAPPEVEPGKGSLRRALPPAVRNALDNARFALYQGRRDEAFDKYRALFDGVGRRGDLRLQFLVGAEYAGLLMVAGSAKEMERVSALLGEIAAGEVMAPLGPDALVASRAWAAQLRSVALENLGRFQAAIDAATEALGHWRALTGDVDRRVPWMLDLFRASLLETLDRGDEALALARGVLEGIQASGTEDAYLTSSVRAVIGHIRAGRAGDASVRADIEAALAEMPAHVAEDPLLATLTLGPSAAAYNNLGDLDAARDLVESSLALLDPRGDADHLFVVDGLIFLAHLDSAQGRIPEAKTHLVRAGKILRRMECAGHPRFALSLEIAARIQAHEGNATKARSYARRAVAIYEAALGPENRYTRAARARVAGFEGP